MKREGAISERETKYDRSKWKFESFGKIRKQERRRKKRFQNWKSEENALTFRNCHSKLGLCSYGWLLFLWCVDETRVHQVPQTLSHKHHTNLQEKDKNQGLPCKQNKVQIPKPIHFREICQNEREINIRKANEIKKTWPCAAKILQTNFAPGTSR